MPDRVYRRPDPRRKAVLTGAERSGYQGSAATLTDLDLADVEEPRYEYPAALIDTMRFVAAVEGTSSTDVMTATSHALQAYLIANARRLLNGQETPEFSVGFKAAMTYLGINSADRLRTHVDAINRTMVTFDLRIPGYRRSVARPLMTCNCDRMDNDGQPVIAYALDPAVRDVMLSARRYALLELNAFRRFRSKYTARLYPSLALLAGQNITSPFVSTPQALAERLGWFPRKFHWGSFLSRVLQPILDDINPADKKPPAVTGFRVEMELVRKSARGEGRSGEVKEIIFHVLPRTPGMRRQPAARLGIVEAAVARSHIAGLDDQHTPAVELIAQAVTATGSNVFQIRDDWAATVRALLHGSNAGHRLRDLLEKHGVGAAFAEWVDKHGMSIPSIDEDHIDLGAPLPTEPVFLVEKTKAERMKDYAMEVANCAMKQANNIRPGRGRMPDTPNCYDDDHILVYADPQMWTMLESGGVEEAALIKAAFGRIADQEPSQMRKSLYNLGGAIADWNLVRAKKIARAIMANPIMASTGLPSTSTSLPKIVPAPGRWSCQPSDDELIPF